MRAQGLCNITTHASSLVSVLVPSTDPTGINLSNDDECVGVSKTLTVLGGTLGTNATWEWYSDAGLITSAGSGSSIVVDPLISTTYYVRAEGDCNNTSVLSQAVTVRVPSTDPTGINLTNDNSCPGTSKVLSLVGGSLGDGANWYWYSNVGLTLLVGTGPTLTVDPLVSSTYYVRAQGDCNNTNVLTQLVTVRIPSTPPTGIAIVGDNTCSGSAKDLTVQGGSLGAGANWYWYSDAGFSTLVGLGASISVDPASSTTYYVRAEGDCNTTTAASQLVLVKEPSVDPTSVNVTNDATCEGTTKTLTVVGGTLGTNATWEWYSDAGFTTTAGSGPSIIVDPASSATYYLRAEGDCNTTTGISQLVTVSTPSVDATSITVTNDATCEGTTKTLTLVGGTLGTNATWEWYSDAGFTTTAGSGPSIIVDPSSSATYYLRAEGDCNTTTGISQLVTVSTPSVDATSITVTNDATCEGTTKTLTVVGGTLGTNATWEWYSDAGFTTTAGSGPSIIVDPSSSATYYLRAEGDCNTTTGISQLVTVSTPSVDATSITVTNDATCEGTTKTLTVVGGTLGTNATWEWYSDAGFTTTAGSGPSIIVDPSSSATYYLRAEGDCNTTTGISQLVTVSTPSVDPTSVNVTNDATCEGTTKTLTVVGGTLGTNATWEWYSDAGFTTTAGSGPSIIVDPSSSATYYLRAEGDCNTTTGISQLVTVSTPSVDATSITVTNDATCEGTTKTLTVVGGTLGTNATWEWYSDAGFTTTAGSGPSIIVDPSSSATYYLRAEGDCNTTTGISQLVTVSTPSVDATSITVTNDATCEGTTKTLTVVGGTLGTNATWEWYSDAGFTTTAGSGPSIIVDPSSSATYYLRAEGDCNTTTGISQLVTVSTPSVDATSITVTNDATCEGTTKTLTVVGGTLGTNATWEWYSDAGFTTTAGSGPSIIVDPSSSATYYLRAEGDCNTTTGISQLVTVSTPSVDPTSVNVTNDATCEGTTKTLTVVGGTLGTNATWEWYSDAGFTTTAGSGPSIIVDPSSSATYYLRAEGDCNTTTGISQLVTVSTPSVDATSITVTNDATCEGTTKTLTVVGGTLGTNATWEWYSDAGFTTTAGSGPSIIVDPSSSATYYLRAEGDCNTTTGISQLVTVSTPSVDATSITVTNDATCEGTTKTLTVVGGTLGTNATWEWYSDAGFTTTAGSGPSIIVDPASSATYYLRAEGDCNTTTGISQLVTVSTPSVDATSITVTNDATCEGTTKTLTVVGGTLGTNATWEWYSDAGFTTTAGSGPSITVDPTITSTYYVRAEGDCNTTAGISQLVTVSTPSVDATSITVTNDATCEGTNKTLTVVGGTLGTNATWEWYSDAGFTTTAGSGPSITVDPTITSTYYVRAEGDCNTTAGISQLVTVSTPSVDATSITVTNDATCEGTNKTLTVVGGTLGTNATWEWYSDAGFTTTAGSGPSITVDPTITSTYYVRAEGDCNTTAGISQLVTVSTPSVDATSITVTNDATCEGTNKTLTVVGGTLGTNATWEWYSDAGFTTTAGSGPSIIVDPSSSATYYLRAEGDCNTTTGISQLVTVSTPSVDATSITVTNDATCEGTTKTLTVVGGTLGTNATWEWYSDAGFTTTAGSGPSIIVDPSSSATYYLRAEGDCNTTTGISQLVTVSTPSVDATSITVGNDATCEGTIKTLTVVGGTLGTNATWEWYSDAGFTTTAGSGPSIIVDPSSSATYYLRAEGDCNTTTGISQLVTVSTPSVDATSITVTNDATCEGTTKTLTVVGGTLGTNATWEWYSDAGFTTTAGSGPSIIVDPSSSATYYLRAEGDCNTTTGISQLVTVSTPSVDATSITVGNDATCEGTTKTLTVVGGTLGTNATWEWYSDAGFTTTAGSGPSIIVDPSSSATYYLRAEGDCNTTTGISQLVTVSTPSVDATSITVTNDATCEGTTKTLTVVGGTLGTNATWEWYSDAGFTTTAGSGPSIIVDPSSSATYYLRAEGDCNTTTGISQLVTVSTPSVDATSITVTNDATCEGTTKTLTVVGGTLGTNATWEWYSDAGFATTAGSGPSIIVDPSSSATYYLRAEGDCNTTTGISQLVTVSTPSVDATSITVTNDATCEGTTKTLTVVGGTLGTNATWEWYSDAGFTTTAGSGPSIIVDPSSSATYYLRAEGDCNTTTGISQLVTVSTPSVDATSITVGNDATCEGTTKTLTVVGGTLGTNATWEWYSDAGFTTTAGSGPSIIVDPSSSATYYLRAEGDCNTTTGISQLVTVSTPSVDATSITVTNDATCEGTTKTLTVVGGTLGTNATWEWYSDAGFTTTAGSGPSIIVDPSSSATYYLRAEGDCNTTTGISQLVTVSTPSVDATSITVTNDATCEGTTKTLTVVGGTLGTNATWEWYSDAGFATTAGSGPSIIVDPSSSATYYLRAEGDCNTTTGISQLVTVSTPSVDATSITVTNDATCEGTTKTLTVVGGTLGTNATWEWYSDAGFTTTAGSGPSIIVDPSSSATYYLRAEGDCNTTTGISQLVTVSTPSVDATSITVTNDATCEGTTKTLTVVGGTLGTNATWEWYSDAGFTTTAGSGPSIIVDPSSSATYYLRAEGDCNTTTGISQLVTVSTPSVDATSITVTNDATCEGTTKTLTVVGGTLGTNATWEWYSDAGFTTTAGSGPSIIVDPSSSATYYLRAEGDCNTTTGISQLVTVSTPSVDATSITVGNDATCEGTTKTLTVVGGTLGTNATWEWYSDAGFTTTAGSGPSIIVDPSSSATYYLRAEGDCNTTTGISQLVTVSTPSVDATSITVGNDATCEGTTKTLTVVGGTLGTNATWEWYSDAGFTTTAGSGPSIIVDPFATTNYYVRAEGDCGITSGISVLVSVSTASEDPSGITIVNDNTCVGTVKQLDVVGGSLGENANWEWYSDAGFATSVGSGPSISVDPLETTNYYVRAEGSCNNSNAIEQEVIVKILSLAPVSASVDIREFCEGDVDNIILNYSGGLLGDGAVANWYTDTLFTGPVIATGNNVNIVAPSDTTTYYVRFEGDCNNTETADVLVIVNPMAEPVITGAFEVCEPQEEVYSVSGNEGSSFNWIVTGGSISGDVSAESISVMWIGEGSGSISVTETTTGLCAATVNSDVIKYASPVASEIETRPGIVCRGELGVAYRIDGLENSAFEWSVEGGIISGDYGDSIHVDWDVPAGNYQVWVLETTENACTGDTLSLILQVEGPELDMGGDSQICEGEVFTLDSLRPVRIIPLE